jgi:hypothetical protein
VVRIGAGIGGFCGRDGVGIGGQRTIIGVGSGGWWCVAQRGVLGRWWAGWPASPPMLRRMRAFWGRFWAAPTLIRAWPAPRWLTTRLAGTSHPHHARRWHLAGARRSYRGRGCPESPHVVMRLPPPRWRCRPARPPTHRDPTLRAAPPRAFRTPMNPR